jgi:hypothetical protein
VGEGLRRLEFGGGPKDILLDLEWGGYGVKLFYEVPVL